MIVGSPDLAYTSSCALITHIHTKAYVQLFVYVVGGLSVQRLRFKTAEVFWVNSTLALQEIGPLRL